MARAGRVCGAESRRRECTCRMFTPAAVFTRAMPAHQRKTKSCLKKFYVNKEVALPCLQYSTKEKERRASREEVYSQSREWEGDHGTIYLEMPGQNC